MLSAASTSHLFVARGGCRCRYRTAIKSSYQSYQSSRYHADDNNYAIILWDIENVRPPGLKSPTKKQKHQLFESRANRIVTTTGGTSRAIMIDSTAHHHHHNDLVHSASHHHLDITKPWTFLRLLKQKWITESGYREWRTVCGATARSLHEFESTHRGFMDNMVTECMLTLGSSDNSKRAADYVIRREMTQFVSTFQSQALEVSNSKFAQRFAFAFKPKEEQHEAAEKQAAKQAPPKIILISGDGDFLEPTQHALYLGFDVQLLYDERSVCKRLLNLQYSSPPQPIGRMGG